MPETLPGRAQQDEVASCSVVSRACSRLHARARGRHNHAERAKCRPPAPASAPAAAHAAACIVTPTTADRRRHQTNERWNGVVTSSSTSATTTTTTTSVSATRAAPATPPSAPPQPRRRGTSRGMCGAWRFAAGAAHSTVRPNRVAVLTRRRRRASTEDRGLKPCRLRRRDDTARTAAEATVVRRRPEAPRGLERTLPAVRAASQMWCRTSSKSSSWCLRTRSYNTRAPARHTVLARTC